MFVVWLCCTNKIAITIKANVAHKMLLRQKLLKYKLYKKFNEILTDFFYWLWQVLLWFLSRFLQSQGMLYKNLCDWFLHLLSNWLSNIIWNTFFLLLSFFNSLGQQSQCENYYKDTPKLFFCFIFSSIKEPIVTTI